MNNFKVYICDDEQIICSFLKSILEGIPNISCQEFNDAESLLAEIFSGKKIDLIISDMTMPKISGYDLARILELRGSPIPILIITGDSLKNDHVALAKKLPNVKGILQKPFKNSALIRRVCEIFDNQPLTLS